MDAPPTPPPMTTARACCFKSCLGAGLRGRGRCRGYRALSEVPVDGADEKDGAERELEDRNAAEHAGDVRVKGVERRVLSADRRIARPQEVDLHRDAPYQAKDVHPEAPLAELEGCIVLR